MLYLGSDHAGYKLKERVKKWLDKQNVEYIDVGNKHYDPDDDYPDYGLKLAKKVNKGKGILFCGSSFGVCIVANKVKGIRAVSVSNIREAELSRLHNDANVLCLSGWHLPFGKAKKIIAKFINTDFKDKGRHLRRINKIKKIEEKWK